MKEFDENFENLALAMQVPNRKPSVSIGIVRVEPSQMIVPSYVVNEHGLTECVPVPECKLARCMHDGAAFELANLMYGTMPEELGQVHIDDAMVTAEKITSECVRRFGSLEKQRRELEKSINTNKDEE